MNIRNLVIAIGGVIVRLLPVAWLPEEVRRARGEIDAPSSRGRTSDNRKKIRAWIAEANLRRALILETPKLRNAAKRVRQGRLSHARFQQLVLGASR